MIERPEPRAAARPEADAGSSTDVAASSAVRTYPWHTAAAQTPDVLALTRPDIQGRRAGFVTRMLANIVDVGIVVGALLGTYAGVTIVKFLWAPRAFHFPAPAFGFVLLLGCAVEFVYLTVAWRYWGRTWGDRLLGLRVLSFRGTRLLWPGATVRSALCVVAPIGLFWVLVSSENRSLQDVLLRTSVVYDWPRRP